MSSKVGELAAQMRNIRANNQPPFILILGAGASLSSDAPTTGTIVEGIVRDYYGPSNRSWEETLKMFYEKLDNFNDDDRWNALNIYFSKDAKPSVGYDKLAELIRDGYFNLIFSTNYDTLLEQTLIRAFGSSYANECEKLVKIGNTNVAEIINGLNRTPPRVKLVKLHGDLPSRKFDFLPTEIRRLPRDLEDYLETRWFNGNLLIVGHAVRDNDLNRCFPDEGSSIWYVNPVRPIPDEAIASIMTLRKSAPNVISGDDGYFDEFFTGLYDEIRGRKPKVKPSWNPFKFFDYYHQSDSEWFFEREQKTSEIINKIERQDTKILSVCEDREENTQRVVGKTSLILAGVIPKLRDKYECIYIRCVRCVEQEFVDAVKHAIRMDGTGNDLEQLLIKLKANLNNKKGVIIFIDQFEEFIKHWSEHKSRLFENLINIIDERLKIVFIFHAELHQIFSRKLLESHRPPLVSEPVSVRPLKKEQVKNMIRTTLDKAEENKSNQFTFEEDLIEQICEEYAKDFNLAYTQAICYQLVKKLIQTKDEYERSFVGSKLPFKRDILQDIINLINNISSESDRKALLYIMKKISEDSQGFLTDEIREIAKLAKSEKFPEPMSLFSIDLKFKRDLDSNNISEELRGEFGNNGIQLSDNATLSIEEKGRRWLVTDKNNNVQTYTIKKERDKIDIYDLLI